MNEVNEITNGLSIVDWAQIIASVGTSIAALSAMITTFQNRSAKKKMDNERHMMVKPSYRILVASQNKLAKKIEFRVINVGFDRVMNSIDFDWNGTHGVEVNVNEIINKNNSDDGSFCEIVLDLSKCDSSIKEIKGKLILVYVDVLGKSYKEMVDVFILYKYNELVDKYTPELQGNMYGKAFS